MAEGSLDLRSVYELVGGMPAFESLVDHFYERVVADDVLRPMYVEDNLTGAKRRLALFLAQYWGGPATYMEERGHPGCGCATSPFPSALPPAIVGSRVCQRRWMRAASQRTLTRRCATTLIAPPRT